MKAFNAKVIGLCVLAAFNTAAVSAGVITQGGAEYEVTVSNISGKTADWLYTADFTNWVDQGDRDYVIAVDFKLTGYTVKNVANFATTAVGDWSAGSAKNSNAGGCAFGTDKTFVCASDDPFEEASGQQINNIGVLTWNFTVTFDKDINEDDLVAENTNHIGAFFQKCSDQGPEGVSKCTNGLGLSENTTFDGGGGGGDEELPIPGTMALFGLALIGLGWARRRKLVA